MQYDELHRPARSHPAPVETGIVRIAPPPQAILQQGNAVWQVLLPMLGSFGIFGFALVMGDRRYLLMAGILAGAMLLSGVVSRMVSSRSLRRRHDDQINRYRDHLREVSRRLEESQDAQQRRSRIVNPSPTELWSVVVDRHRIWERRPPDVDFMTVRIGLGDVQPLMQAVLDLSSNPLTDHDAVMLAEAEAVASGNRALAGEPVEMDLSRVGCLAVIGRPDETRQTVRSIIGQLAVFRAPDELRLVVWHGRDASADWAWCRLIPHTRLTVGPEDPAVTDSVGDLGVILDQIAGPRRAILEAASRDMGDRKLTPTGSDQFPRTVVVIDTYDPTGDIGTDPAVDDLLGRASDLGFTFVCLVPSTSAVPDRADVTMTFRAGRLDFAAGGPNGVRHLDVIPDRLGLDHAANLSRVLEPMRLRTRTGRATTVDSAGLLDLLGIASIDEIGPESWMRNHDDHLRVPIGLAEDGSRIMLDLKESSVGGQGPHGVLIGATGSGKSELLRTLVLGLAARHAPEDLAMVMVDFKGGATFARLDQLPHTAGMITNLERDPGLIDRMQEALHGELERRQRVLHSAGMDRADHYRAHRITHPELGFEPMPALLVIVDEFGELLANRPEFAELFMTIGRTGRSLGVHLLLSSQRLDEGRIRKLEGHLRYRLCLRTFTPEESQMVIGTKAAAELPPIPGVGFFGVDGGLQPFKAGYVSRPIRGVSTADGSTPTEMSVLIDRLGVDTESRRARPMWLEPLPTRLGLSQQPLTRPNEPGWLAPIIGLRDDPRAQLVHPHRLLLNGAAGHLAVIGAPRSGKSTFLKTMVSTMALTHDPSDLQIYAVDLGGGGLHPLESLPHVGAVLGRSHRREVPRLVRQLRALVDQRSELFRLHGLTDMSGFHTARSEGQIVSELGEVVLVIDNWAVFNQEFDLEAADQILELVTGGLHYGVHVIVTASRWQDLRMSMRDNIGGRFELHLNDPIDSEIDRVAAGRIPVDLPGRGIGTDTRPVQVALPTFEPDGTLADLGDVIGRVGIIHPGADSAPPVRLLPDRVELETIRTGPGRGSASGVTLGLEETMLGPWNVDLFAADPHFVVLGDAESGKTNLLRTLVRQLVARHGPDQVQIALVDRRRRLIGEVPESHRMAFAATPESIAALAASVVGRLRTREVPDELAVIAHAGPEIVVIVDDYDQVITATGNPLASLTDWVVQARDVGFHLVLARRVGGVTRSSFEPLYQRVKEIGTPGIILSGDPAEGPVLGNVRPMIQPPGRGVVVGRGRSVEVQVAETHPSADVSSLPTRRSEWG